MKPTQQQYTWVRKTARKELLNHRWSSDEDNVNACDLGVECSLKAIRAFGGVPWKMYPAFQPVLAGEYLVLKPTNDNRVAWRKAYWNGVSQSWKAWNTQDNWYTNPCAGVTHYAEINLPDDPEKPVVQNQHEALLDRQQCQELAARLVMETDLEFEWVQKFLLNLNKTP